MNKGIFQKGSHKDMDAHLPKSAYFKAMQPQVAELSVYSRWYATVKKGSIEAQSRTTEIQGGQNDERIETTDSFEKCKRNFTGRTCFPDECYKAGGIKVGNRSGSAGQRKNHSFK